MDSTLPAVARSVYTSCKKCGAERYHRVLAHTSKTAAKVQCEVCGANKNFSIGAKKKKAAKEGDAPPVSRSAKRWNDLKGKSKGDSIPYSMITKFSAQSSLTHPKFGLGFVEQVTGEKILVVFEDGERYLMHNRPK